ncbi:hypothetical protein BC936DRAFT_145026 [Jimgerdemannia flammicorona]|uniref:RlpA-like double-psi beta-barrel-protein domain-containing protein-containing protein n=1 Tax=Jimgerdemannia flammicorona TaxID=994334 RepID=A0A433DB47_9FUNG|nr:hypothetical protein BC936DRAFT_145026 [Jimgerdemannia flammicorona]
MRYITLLTLAVLVLAVQTVAQGDDNEWGRGRSKGRRGKKGKGKKTSTKTTKTTKPTTTTNKPPKPTPGGSYTVKNVKGTMYGKSLDGNACNISGADPAVAVNPSWFKSDNTNNDPICGKTMTITNSKGKTMTARVVDQCVTCGGDNIDMT